MEEHVNFSLVEILIACALYLYFVPFCFYEVYEASTSKQHMLSFDLHPSWWFGRKMDDSDYEWRFWANFFSQNIYLFGLHALLGLAINHQLEKGRIYANICYSLIALCMLFGVKQLTFIICTVCLVYLSVIVFRRKSVVWIVSLLTLGLLNMQGSSKFLRELCRPDPAGTRYVALVYAMSTTNLRMISLGTDMLDDFHQSAGSDLVPLYKALCYALYFPTFLTGPFVPYSDFIECMHTRLQPLRLAKLKWFLRHASSLIFYWLSMEICLHYLYTSALQQEEYYLMSANNLTVFSLCLVQAFLFNIKYLFVFGVPTLFARLDGVHMPPRPAFLLTQYKASNIWRRFDVGLYTFVTRYLYVPMGGSYFGLSQQVVVVFICFIYIGYWHGASLTMFVWALMNFLSIVAENIRSQLLKSRLWAKVMANFGVEAAFRIQMFILAPIGVVSLWSMFVFLGGHNVGYNLYKKLFKNASLEFRITLVGLAYWHIVFARSLENGSLKSALSDCFYAIRSVRRPTIDSTDTNHQGAVRDAAKNSDDQLRTARNKHGRPSPPDR